MGRGREGVGRGREVATEEQRPTGRAPGCCSLWDVPPPAALAATCRELPCCWEQAGGAACGRSKPCPRRLVLLRFSLEMGVRATARSHLLIPCSSSPGSCPNSSLPLFPFLLSDVLAAFGAICKGPCSWHALGGGSDVDFRMKSGRLVFLDFIHILFPICPRSWGIVRCRPAWLFLCTAGRRPEGLPGSGRRAMGSTLPRGSFPRRPTPRCVPVGNEPGGCAQEEEAW